MKKLSVVYIAAVLSLCTLPLLLTPIWGEKSSAEKRDLAEFPALIEDGAVNPAFSEELDGWITDHFAFRSELITANNLLKAKLFHSSDEDQVIVGKNGWLYFAETAADYLGQNLLSEADIRHLATTLDLMEAYVSRQGGRLVFAVAPNKNTLYPENMPVYYRQTAEETNLDRLTHQLTGKAYFADLKKALKNVREQTYHARDSHWNNIGALQAYNTLLDTAGTPHETYADTSWEWQRTWEGDLDAMIFPKLGIRDWQAVFHTEWTYQYTSNFHSEEDLLIITENKSGSGSLLIFRDSFSNALLPFLAQRYETAKFSRAVPYALYELEDTPYDTVILEIAERNLRNLLMSAPIMPAPLTEEAEAPLETDAVLKTRTVNGYRHYYGYLEEADAQNARRIYLRLSNGTDVRYAEAFPIYESALLDSEEVQSNGFSAYLPADQTDGYQVSVVIQPEKQAER